ncbi:transcriptional regulator, XRE [Brevibacillus agri BAB-2500]|nr:transcriptional regulator, XRE [Brevibacillus agri BAB-2500]
MRVAGEVTGVVIMYLAGIVRYSNFYSKTSLIFEILVQYMGEVISMYGLGKKRSKLGKWLDQRGITQQWLSKKSGVNNNTVSYMASDDDYLPTMNTAKKILGALREIDPNVNLDDFWPK